MAAARRYAPIAVQCLAERPGREFNLRPIAAVVVLRRVGRSTEPPPARTAPGHPGRGEPARGHRPGRGVGGHGPLTRRSARSRSSRLGGTERRDGLARIAGLKMPTTHRLRPESSLGDSNAPYRSARRLPVPANPGAEGWIRAQAMRDTESLEAMDDDRTDGDRAVHALPGSEAWASPAGPTRPTRPTVHLL
jgi:hypothetical protein